MPATSNRLIALACSSLVAVLTLSACGDVPRVNVTPSPSTERGVSVVQDVKTVDRATELAEISRVARDVRKVGDAVRAETVRKAAFVIAVSKIPTVRARVVIGDAISVSGCGGVVGDLLARYFADDLAWATRTVMRESGCNPGAVNQREGCDTSGRTNSHAMGLFQMCYPLHAAIFASVGCSDPLDAECNVKASRALYDGAGRGPWGG